MQLSETLYKVGYPVILSQSFNAKPADLIRTEKELKIERLIAKHKGSFSNRAGVVTHGLNTSSIGPRNS